MSCDDSDSKKLSFGRSVEPGFLRQLCRDARGEFRMRVDAGADGGAALRQRVQPRLHRPNARNAAADLRSPAAEFLTQRDRHRIHQVRASGL